MQLRFLLWVHLNILNGEVFFNTMVNLSFVKNDFTLFFVEIQSVQWEILKKGSTVNMETQKIHWT